MTTVYRAADPNSEFRATQQTTVSVSGTVIAAAAIAREMQHHEAATPGEAWTAAARALVVRELLLQEASRIGLMPHPSRDEDGREETGEEALIRELAEKQITVPTASEAECRRYYDHNQQRFRSADIYEASHILIATPPDDEKRHAKLKGKAAELCEILRRDPAQFEVLAGQHSECPSAGAGGNLGQISPGTTVAEFEDALIAMTPGTIGPEPIETRYGFHIVRLDKRIEGRLMPFEMVQERIASYLDERATRLATAQYLALIASRSRIEGVDLPMPSDVGALPQ